MKILIEKDKWDSLISIGVPKSVLRHKPIDLEYSTCFVEITTKNNKPLTLKKKDQIKMVKKFEKDPLKTPMLYCISSNPTDSEAKYVAAYLLSLALTDFRKLQRKGLTNKIPPAWWVVTGIFKDDFRDRKRNPSFLVLSNVTDDSTQIKLEKVRDLIELYADVPKILVTTSMDPLSFVKDKLKLKANAALYLKVVKSHDNATEI